MSIGGDYSNNNNGNNQNGKLFENTYYSRLRIKNADSKLALGFSFKSGLMYADISELKDPSSYKYESLESICLSPTKAGILYCEINSFKEFAEECKKNGSIDTGKAFGVNAGLSEKVSYIAFHLSEDGSTCITIGKIDGSGNILERATIMLNRDYHYGLEWTDIDNMQLEKNTYDDVELTQIQYILNDFSRAMSGATAYSFADLTRYDNARILKKMDPIYDKLGIERLSSNGYSNNGGSRSNNFLNSISNKSSNNVSIDSIEDMLED